MAFERGLMSFARPSHSSAMRRRPWRWQPRRLYRRQLL